MNRKLLPVVLELFGIAVVGAGIGIEFVYEADWGFVAITSGSLFIAMGGVIWGKFVRRG
ncbi:hypothetical protein LCGC14_1967590 [marine sediment metagenome]|uniref:Uncharacterized protein n=1 Tax=marine sediment metagenome TaxID=412755 RepID=A0A0F9FD19_9ZZZZ